jgi:hypothetical protein
MKVYLASSWGNPGLDVAIPMLQGAGHEVYDFRNAATAFDWEQIYASAAHAPIRSNLEAKALLRVLQHPRVLRAYALDRAKLAWCDALVMLQPCGVSAGIELGFAAGLARRTVVVLANGQKPDTMLNVAECVCTSVEDAIAWLEKEDRWLKGR